MEWLKPFIAAKRRKPNQNTEAAKAQPKPKPKPEKTVARQMLEKRKIVVRVLDSGVGESAAT